MSVQLPYIPYFRRTARDAEYYECFLQPRLPAEIFDVHMHLNLPEHVSAVDEQRLISDWALECGHVLSCDDAYAVAAELFPGCAYRIAGFPWPIREADLRANNEYLAQMKRDGRLEPFMALRPEWDLEEVERTLLQGGFVGFKPYPDIVSGVKGADIGIFDFLPKPQWRIADKHKKAVMLHLPRKQRLADPDNITELLEARERFPDTEIIVAHLGRAFCPYFLEKGLSLLGSAVKGFRFDISGVTNPEVLDMAFERIDPRNILFGSDMPIFLWHGTRRWTERTYLNISREKFHWNTVRPEPEEAEEFTLFLYEQLRHTLDSMDRHGLGDPEKAGVFGGNAQGVLKL